MRFALLFIMLIGPYCWLFAQQDTINPVEQCNIRGHMNCIRITAGEVYRDGSKGKWSDHWGRMSYIGRACVSEKGEKKGRTLETIFAPFHYFAMFFVNVSGLATAPFRRSQEEFSQLEENISVIQ